MLTLILLFGLIVVSTVNSNANRYCPLSTHGHQQRPGDTPDITFYDKHRNPSYCDRVILGWLNNHPDDANLKVFQYNAITDEYIDESDHDLVYGYFSFHNINILSVSFNLGDFVKGSIKKQIAWDTIICSIKAALHRNAKQKEAKDGIQQPAWEDIDIFFFGFQETDFPFKYNKLSKAIKRQTKSDELHKWKTVFKSFGARRLAYKNVASYVLYNAKTVYHEETEDKTKIDDEYPMVGGDIATINFEQEKTEKVVLHTKTSVIIGKFRKIRTESKKHSFRSLFLREKADIKDYSEEFVAFANAHLPIITKGSEDLGVEWRNMGMKAMENNFKQVFNAQKTEANNLLVLVGDLNYRITDSSDLEQLDTYLKAQADAFWHEIDKRAFKPTCKRVPGSWNAWKTGNAIIPKKKLSAKKIIGRKVRALGTLVSETMI